MPTHTQFVMNINIVVLLAIVMASVDQSYFGAPNLRTVSTGRLFLHAGQVVLSLAKGLKHSLFVSCVEMCSKMATIPGLFCVLLRAS